ncbi:iron complex outermembrane recepter protein [Pseudoalteromonas citrea]|uniref:Iron complex outermembrane recepter protein n=2 Tax=Pseudoalteromonas citrea TaxID=43655 RepID=A0AAD4AKP7_9GAMM|nr:TonB-dependent receptor [Pseudoalteromonas citrea]KAF7773985.1 iron complex outermembrane recepter protein [Pseudoalteromonas citrea]
MLANNFKKSLLALNVGLVLSAGASGVAFAAEENKVQEDVEVIEVRGIRRSLEASMNTKRFANSVVDSVSAEDIGDFPDNNLAESLGRVPGVTVSRQFGEGSAVSIRGASNQLTKTSLNGQNVASTGWYTEQAIDRSFNYSMLAPEMIASMDVYKSAQADIVEGGVGGTVIVKTRRPLDLDANTVFGSIKMTGSTASDENDASYSGLYSWKNEAETFGVLGALAKSDYSLERIGDESLPAWAGRIAPTNFKQQRERTATDIQLQYAPTDSLDFGLHYMNLELNANNLNTQIWIPQNFSNCSSTNAQGIPTNCTATQAWIDSDDVILPYYDVRPRQASMETEVVAFDMTYVGDAVKIEFQIGSTEATGGTNFETNYATLTDKIGSLGTINAEGDRIQYDMTSPVYEATTLNVGDNSIVNSPNKDSEDYAQVDFTFQLESEFFTSIKTGVRWVHHEVEKSSNRPLLSNTDAAEGLLLGTISAGKDSFTIPEPNADAMISHTKGLITEWVESRSGFSNIVEDNFSGYVMANFSHENVRGNMGLRYISTSVSSDTYARLDGFVDPILVANNGYSHDIVTEESNYNEVLPSINVAVDVQEDVIVRFSAATVIARPNYNDMFTSSSLKGFGDNIIGNESVEKGSVALSPFKANQADIGVEWYYNSSSLVALSYFTKQVDTFTTADSIANQSIGIVDPDSQLDSWRLDTYKDGRGGDINGVEFQWQHTFDNGFGGVFNYTYADAKADAKNYTDRNNIFTDSSKHTTNLVGFYEDDAFSARAAYTWRSDYMIREVGFYGNREHQDFGTLDLSFSYKINDNFTVVADITNLLEEDSIQIGRDQGEIATLQRTSNGYPAYSYEGEARYSLGVQFRF